MINLLREEEESHLNLEKFLYLVNPGHVPAGTQNWFNFVPLASVTGVVYFANTPCCAGAETPKWKADKILHIQNQKQPMRQSNNAELLSCSFPLALQNQPTYDPCFYCPNVTPRVWWARVTPSTTSSRGGLGFSLSNKSQAGTNEQWMFVFLNNTKEK